MDDKPSCCSGAGCIFALVAVLVIIGYLLYTSGRVKVVYNAGSAQEQVNEVEQRQKESQGRPLPRFNPIGP